MSKRVTTDKELDDALAKAAERYAAEHACPECGVEMSYVCQLAYSETQGSTDLYQCPKCKTVKEL